MKKILFFTAGWLMSCSLYAQTANVVLFTEEGERFTAILNGARQNPNPETQVKVTNLNAEFYKMKILFEDVSKGSMDKTLYLAYGTERAYSIKKNKNGEYVLRMVSESPLAQLPPPMPDQVIVSYNSNPSVAGVVITETTTTTVGGTTDNVSMGVNVGGAGINMNININDGMGAATTTTTTTTSYSTSTGSSGTVAPPPSQNVYVLPGYNGPVGCPWPMSQQDFSGVQNTISSKSFEDSKLQIAKQVINSNCLLSSQVREIMIMFSFEDSKLDFAKYAYGYTFDIGNYYKVNDAFGFESSIDDLDLYINSRK